MGGTADLGGKQVMIVGGKAHAQLTLRTALNVAGIKHVEVLSDSRAAIELLRVERFDALYIDERAPSPSTGCRSIAPPGGWPAWSIR
jgi:hypothetical protein